MISLGVYKNDTDTLPVFAVVNRSAKRITLRYDVKNHQARVTLPAKRFLPQAEKLIQQHQEWLFKCISNNLRQVVKPNSRLAFLGKDFLIRHVESSKKQIWVNESEIIVYGKHTQFGRHLQEWIMGQATNFFRSECSSHLVSLGLSHLPSIKIQDRKTAWGSCSSKSVLAFSWRLVFAPLEVAQYVAAHEVSHLLEMNHSSKFWDIVSTLCPRFKEHRSWLKNNGKLLFSYQFR